MIVLPAPEFQTHKTMRITFVNYHEIITTADREAGGWWYLLSEYKDRMQPVKIVLGKDKDFARAERESADSFGTHSVLNAYCITQDPYGSEYIIPLEYIHATKYMWSNQFINI